MKNQRGFTLIEAMITVAILGIVAVTVFQAGTGVRLSALEVLQQERATQVLEFEAEALSTGVSPNAEVEQTLLAALPRARLERTRSGRTVTVKVTWGHQRTTTRELTVFTKEGR